MDGTGFRLVLLHLPRPMFFKRSPMALEYLLSKKGNQQSHWVNKFLVEFDWGSVAFQYPKPPFLISSALILIWPCPWGSHCGLPFGFP